jgi:hypothetical protein
MAMAVELLWRLGVPAREQDFLQGAIVGGFGKISSRALRAAVSA